MFAFLKMFQILQGGHCDSIVTKEMELDVAMALQNLLTRERFDIMDGIPARAPFAPHAHIITRTEENVVKLPTKKDLADKGIPLHLKEFRRDITSHAGEILKALSSGGADQMFSTRNEKRGDNLFNGGNVLQVGAHCVGEREWVVRFNVGAHMKAFSYNCYLKMTVGSNIFASTCECVGG